jgi:hypothetical protein
MLIGLFVINWAENIAEILLRSPGRVSFIAGVCALLLMMVVDYNLLIGFSIVPHNHLFYWSGAEHSLSLDVHVHYHNAAGDVPNRVPDDRC